jgi:hypothetical protein
MLVRDYDVAVLCNIDEIVLIMTFEQWSWIASIAGSLIALVAFPMVVWQLHIGQQQRKDAVRLSTSQVLLAADGVLASYAGIAEKLRPGGDWAIDSKNHPNDEELALVEPYLGVFERIFVAVAAGQLQGEIVDQLYGYRLANIWNNDRLVEAKLQNARLKHSWKRLIALTYVVEAHRARRLKGHTDRYFPEDLFDQRQAKYIRGRLQEN